MQWNSASEYAKGWKSFLDLTKLSNNAQQEWIEARLKADVHFLKTMTHLNLMHPANVLSTGGCKVRLPKEGVSAEAYQILIDDLKRAGMDVRNQSIGLPYEFEVFCNADVE